MITWKTLSFTTRWTEQASGMVGGTETVFHTANARCLKLVHKQLQLKYWTRLALCQYTGPHTGPQYVHRSENAYQPNPLWEKFAIISRIRRGRSYAIRAVRSYDNNATEVKWKHTRILLSSAMTMGTSCKLPEDVSKRSREQIQPTTIPPPPFPPKKILKKNICKLRLCPPSANAK